MTKRAYYGGGRQRTGSLVPTKNGWAARFTAIVDGKSVRVQRQLGTSNKAVAKIKLAELLESEAPATAAIAKCETFEAAARRIVAQQREEGLATHAERLSRLERWAFPDLGKMLVTAIRPAHVRSVLEAIAATGKSRTTCTHLKNDISGVLADLWRDEVVTENVAKRVTVPKTARVDDRQRVILSDPEFEQLMAWPELDSELRTMAMSSRCFGGMRTSDLHGWDWRHIDTDGWLDAHVPRPKTKTRDRLALPAVLVPVLQTWWLGAGKPSSGPVFPLRAGARAGQRRGKMSHARELRKALWAAGVRRGASKGACELQTDTAETRRVDFHSFRRAFNTGLATAGVNVQTAMRLAGHRNATTHMRYVLIAERLEVPAEALPKQKALPTPNAELLAALSARNDWRPQRDLNSCYRRERPMS